MTQHSNGHIKVSTCFGDQKVPRLLIITDDIGIKLRNHFSKSQYACDTSFEHIQVDCKRCVVIPFVQTWYQQTWYQHEVSTAIDRRIIAFICSICVSADIHLAGCTAMITCAFQASTPPGNILHFIHLIISYSIEPTPKQLQHDNKWDTNQSADKSAKGKKRKWILKGEVSFKALWHSWR